MELSHISGQLEVASSDVYTHQNPVYRSYEYA